VGGLRVRYLPHQPHDLPSSARLEVEIVDCGAPPILSLAGPGEPNFFVLGILNKTTFEARRLLDAVFLERCGSTSMSTSPEGRLSVFEPLKQSLIAGPSGLRPLPLILS
jgi:hypothetical protein